MGTADQFQTAGLSRQRALQIRRVPLWQLKMLWLLSSCQWRFRSYSRNMACAIADLDASSRHRSLATKTLGPDLNATASRSNQESDPRVCNRCDGPNLESRG